MLTVCRSLRRGELGPVGAAHMWGPVSFLGPLRGRTVGSRVASVRVVGLDTQLSSVRLFLGRIHTCSMLDQSEIGCTVPVLTGVDMFLLGAEVDIQHA